MKRSTQVAAPLLASAALAFLSACRKPAEMQRCVDEHNVVVADKLCANLPNQQNGLQNGQQNVYPGGFGYFPYRWYYGGYGGYGLGSTIGGGGYAPIGGHAYASSSSTSRGGFGSTHASGGEGGGE